MDDIAAAGDARPFDDICEYVRAGDFFAADVFGTEYPFRRYGHSRVDHRGPACEADELTHVRRAGLRH
jgi:hypothetical protein